jgi:transposase
MGPLLGAEFLVAVRDLCVFESADRLAAYAGLVPAANDSGKRVVRARRMRGGNKTLFRVFYQSAFSLACAALRSPEPSTIARELRARGTPRL